jgi:hypothetical protein
MSLSGHHVIFMKVGVHAGEDLAAILERKQRETATAGWCLWGYGGSACHPVTQVQPHAAAGQPVRVLFIETSSVPAPSSLTASEYSADGSEWNPLPSGHRVTGSRWALVLTALSRQRLEIDLGAYQAAVGPSAGKGIADYLRGRSDKACAVLTTAIPNRHKQVLVTATADLAAPYGVFLR